MGMFGKKPATADAASPSSPAANDPRAATAPSPVQEEPASPSPPGPPGIGKPQAKTEKRVPAKQNKVELTVKTEQHPHHEPNHDRKKNMEEVMEDASLGLDDEEMGHASPSSPKHKHVAIPSREVKELQQKLEFEQHEKAELEDSNEELRAKVAVLKRKLLSAVAIKEKDSVKANRVPVSVEDLESEKHKLEENFAVFIKKLEKAEAERDKVQNDFSEAQIQFAQRLSYDTLQSPSAFTPKLQKNIKSLDQEFEATGSPTQASKSPTIAPPAAIHPSEADEKVRKAKTQLEYNAYVKTKAK
ncbi:UNVERIFIED_CONTAM: hypothetical protein HDU68_000850 [Siphonaria sp. JEL0065]|nr:hypothetical protein HDU68_000850 [Siphonaria sp. JEL0065]